jgi:hypothetical protein
MTEEELRRYLLGQRSQSSTNKYAAGAKRYGPNGSSAPTTGPVDPTGYKTRDAGARSTRNAMLRRLQARMRGAYASEDALNPQATAQAATQPLNQLLGWYN